jgi:TRAP-type uncharacterized transport system fused permease subunit
MLVIILAQFRKETRLTLKRFIHLLEEIGRVIGELIGLLGPAGLLIGSFVISGLAYSLPNEIVGLSGGNVFLMLLLGATSAFILGMGVTVTVVYIFLAIVLAPGLVATGFDLMATHLFILYCGMWSYITPPVCLTSFAAATVAGAAPMRTGYQAMKLGVAKYILPFAFVLNPALILRGNVIEVLLASSTALVGLIIISGALEGYFWRLGTLTMVSRVLFFGAGLLLAAPTSTTDLYGISAFAIIFGVASILQGRSHLSAVLVKHKR